ncbi:MAG: hypothetical protein A2289_24155 [Deltaproteobacteria bacterium RIFOXYA12_FULL_58_15]|nr:MAG: hypothetical protein A2289_24155 [Deltaproteobacteria bacterium RIFOXYA12_FULL_58_15]OGR08027.1 MAG: hypothetical protein A2341_04060 [Deltaproteobacteria bacterium RIFOXYB12_FULL_58_9]
MDYLEYFGFNSEPFSNAPLSRFYFASRQHTEALERLRYAASTMKGLAILVGDIGLGKTTLARRMLEALPDDEYEAAMLVIVHAGINASWLLKRIAIQLGVPDPAEDKLTILSQLYQRLVQIHDSGKRTVVLIDEAQMLATRELMEEFRGLLNLEVPERKLISFIFFGLPEIERNLRLDPPLAQRIALRVHMKPLGRDDTLAYIEHRLSLAGGKPGLFDAGALERIFSLTRGVPRMVNTLCDNLLLEMFFARQAVGNDDLVVGVAENLGFGKDFDVSSLDAEPEPQRYEEEPAIEGGAGADAIVAVAPYYDDDIPEVVPMPSFADGPPAETALLRSVTTTEAATGNVADAETDASLPVGADPHWPPPVAVPVFEPDAIAAQVAAEPFDEDLLGEGDAIAVTAIDEPRVDSDALPEFDAIQEETELCDNGPPVLPVQSQEQTTVDVDDPLAFLEPTSSEPMPSSAKLLELRSPWDTPTAEENLAIDVEVEVGGVELDDVNTEELEGIHVEIEEDLGPSADKVGQMSTVVPERAVPDLAVMAEPAVVDSVQESAPEPQRALKPEPTVLPKPKPAGRPKVDLSEIDALLADIDSTLRK